MKQKIGTGTCPDCGYPECDIGLDKKGHPYRVCWGAECGGSQYFSHGRRPRVRSVLATYKPIQGAPSAAELRAKYRLDEAAPAPAPAPKPAPAPAAKPAPAAGDKAPAAKPRAGFQTLMD